MPELSSRAAGIETTNAAPRVVKWRSLLRGVGFLVVVALISVSWVYAQSPAVVRQPPPPRAIYTPKPIYRPEWAKQGLTGKGIVLVTIDKQRGNVTGARMVTSTGNSQLDGAALQAYSQWRFDPRTVVVPQLKIPIEFATRPRPPAAKLTKPPTAILCALLILVGFGVAVMVMRARRRV